VSIAREHGSEEGVAHADVADAGCRHDSRPDSEGVGAAAVADADVAADAAAGAGAAAEGAAPTAKMTGDNDGPTSNPRDERDERDDCLFPIRAYDGEITLVSRAALRMMGAIYPFVTLKHRSMCV
jgi:hypothetical protein